MLFILKKSRLISGFLILSLLTFLCGIVNTALPSGEETFLPSVGKKIIIDAGHGAPDGGAVGQSGAMEKDINLSVALELQKFFESGGTNVVLTRSDDNGIYDISGSIKNKKVSDMKNREKIINESGADIFISIHMNKFSDSRYSGPQVFYSPNHEKSEYLAECIQKSMIAALNPESEREIKKAGKDIYLLNKAEIPAVLAECGFLSNSTEEKKLTDEKYQRQLAWSLYCGVIEYFNEK